MTATEMRALNRRLLADALVQTQIVPSNIGALWVYYYRPDVAPIFERVMILESAN